MCSLGLCVTKKPAYVPEIKFNEIQLLGPRHIVHQLRETVTSHLNNPTINLPILNIYLVAQRHAEGKQIVLSARNRSRFASWYATKNGMCAVKKTVFYNLN